MSSRQRILKGILGRAAKGLLVIVSSLSAAFVLNAGPVLAAPAAAASEPPRLAEIVTSLVRIVDVFYAFGGIIFLLLAIAIGIQWMASGGDDEKIKELRQRISYLVIGFILYFLSATIVYAIYGALNVKDCTGNNVVPGFNIILEGTCK